MIDGIFFINSALRVSNLSVYSYEERYEHMIATLDSIDKYCPSNKKFIFDSSPQIDKEDYDQLSKRATVAWCGGIPEVAEFSSYGTYGSRSIAETIAFIHFLNWFRTMTLADTLNHSANRIYKLSGRYKLNENFIADDESYKDAFVFGKAHDTWMADQRKDVVDKLYPLRLWHMDYSLLNTFHTALPYILQDCATYGIDVEHSYYKNLHKYDVVEVNKIGVCGNTAPDGAYIDE
jgi:hypothetical protein